MQSLSIGITSSRSKHEVVFVKSERTESSINKDEFQQQQEWNLYTTIEELKTTINDAWTNTDRPCIRFSATISRKPGYFLYNAYMLIFLITTLGFTPFSFNHTFPHFRIQTTCLLILSSINFRWAVTQKLPCVSYLTTLDKYALGALVFLVLLCVWHAIIGCGLISETQAVSIDQYVLAGIAALFFLFHIAYIVFFIYKYTKYLTLAEEEKKKEQSNAKSYKKDVETSSMHADERIGSSTPLTSNTPNLATVSISSINFLPKKRVAATKF